MTVQYARWVSRAVRGDLGQSIVLRRPVLGEVLDRFKNTSILAVAAIFISFVFGILLGVVSAVHRGTASTAW